jgi:DNA-binding MarR family transcriptional regulator
VPPLDVEYLDVKIPRRNFDVKTLDVERMRTLAERDSIDRWLEEVLEQFPTVEPEVEAAVDRVWKLSKHLDRLWESTAERFDLDGGECKVLLKLRQAPGRTMTPGQLSTKLVLSTGAMTNRLDHLEDAGLIRRDRDEHDRRSVIVRLTDRGAAVIEEAIAAEAKEESRVMAALKPDEQRRLNQLLRKLILVFERERA